MKEFTLEYCLEDNQALLCAVFSSGHRGLHYMPAKLVTLGNNPVLHQRVTIGSQFDRVVPTEMSVSTIHSLHFEVEKTSKEETISLSPAPVPEKCTGWKGKTAGVSSAPFFSYRECGAAFQQDTKDGRTQEANPWVVAVLFRWLSPPLQGQPSSTLAVPNLVQSLLSRISEIPSPCERGC